MVVLAGPGAAGQFTATPTLTVQVDAVSLDGPAGQSALEFRRVRAGARGEAGPWASWGAEIDVAQDRVRVTNLHLAIAPPDVPVSLVVGQVFPPTSLETLSTANGASFLERAQLHDLFGFGRRLGAVVAYERGDVLLTASAFGNDLRGNLPPGNRFVALRGVWAPSVAGGRLHLGANAKWRDAGSRGTLRYAARPGSALIDALLLDSGQVQASGDRNLGVELAGVFGRLSFASEVQRARLLDAAPDGLGRVTAGYAEVGWYLTPGDSKAYQPGRFGRTVPSRPLGEGGAGAWQASLRGDWSDVGARQQILSASLHWSATAHLRMIAQVSRVGFDPEGLAPRSVSTLVGLRTHIIY